MEQALASLETHRAVVMQDHLPFLATWLERIIIGIELFAVLLLLVGLVRFIWDYLASEFNRADMVARVSRANLGRIALARYILMALEVFIVADILALLLSASFVSLLFLAVLVVVRSLISHFLEKEIQFISSEPVSR